MRRKKRENKESMRCSRGMVGLFNVETQTGLTALLSSDGRISATPFPIRHFVQVTWAAEEQGGGRGMPVIVGICLVSRQRKTFIHSILQFDQAQAKDVTKIQNRKEKRNQP